MRTKNQQTRKVVKDTNKATKSETAVPQEYVMSRVGVVWAKHEEEGL